MLYLNRNTALEPAGNALPMKLVDKYLLKEYLVPEFYCLSTFSLIFIVYDLFDHLSKFLKAQTPPALITKYYLCLLLPKIEYIVPASLLLATLYALWRLTRNNELTAFRTSGMSLYRIMLPFLGVGLVFTIASGLVKELIAPRAEAWAEAFKDNAWQAPQSRVLEDQAYFNSAGLRQWLIGSFDLAEPHRLNDVRITQENADGTRQWELAAEKAEWLDGAWWLYAPQFQKFGEEDQPVGSLTPLDPNPTEIREIPEFTETPRDFAIEFKNPEFLTTLELRHYLQAHPEMSDTRIAETKYQFHRRLALPWACFIVVLFGIPAGNRGGRKNALAGIFLAMFFFLGFYALMQFGTFVGVRGIVEPWVGAWLSNILFLVAGLVMIVQMR